MPLTAEERAEINRQNAAKSTGPKTDKGKASSRRNALKHGLRAEALALPNEDPTVVAVRSDAWNDYYQPQSPAAQHLVNSCVSATLLSDRCRKYHEAVLSKQVRDAEYAWDVEREEAVAALVVMLKTDPATAARRLVRTGHGCRWLIERWEDLLRVLDDRGEWTGPERDEAIRIRGFNPDGETIQECPDAWLILLLAMSCPENPSKVGIEWLFESHHRPDLYRDAYRVNLLPARDYCQTALREMAATELTELRANEASHREFSEDPDRAGAADRALILHDIPSARLFLRYQAEARTSFHRAYGSLVKTLDLDATGGPAVSPIEPMAPVLTPDEPTPSVESVSPIEADSDPEPGETTPSYLFPEIDSPLASPAEPGTVETARTEGETAEPERRIA